MRHIGATGFRGLRFTAPQSFISLPKSAGCQGLLLIELHACLRRPAGGPRVERFGNGWQLFVGLIWGP